MIKVAMVTAFPRSPEKIYGGVAGAAKYLADELVKMPDVRLTIVAPQGAPGSGLVVERWGALEVHRLPKLGVWRRAPGTIYDLAAGKRQLARYLERLEPDVAHFQATSYLAAHLPVRTVLTIHGIAEKDAMWDPRPGPERWLKRELLRATESYGRRAATNVILISEAAKAVVPDSPDRRFWRIANPIADTFFEVPRRPVPGRLFCCSRVTPLKNLRGMIEAFARMARRVPAAELRIAGDGEEGYLEECRAEARRRGVADRVTFLGGLSVDGVQRELSRAACYALPSFQENAPLSLAEAMAAGVPAIAARVGGVPEMVAHGDTGLLVDPRDVRALADAAEALLGDPLRAAEMGRRAAARARARYKASVVAQRTSEVYREVVERR